MCQNLAEIHCSTAKFKAAFSVEVDKKEVYDATERLKSLLDAEKESAKPCLVKFMPG